MAFKHRKPVEALRVPLNCLISPATKELVTGIQNQSKESQGEIVDRAVALLALGEEVAPKKAKLTRNQQAVAERAATDVIAQSVGRNDIDYSDVESTPTTNVAHLDAVGVKMSDGYGKASIENWRRNRKPILKPKEQK